MDHADHNEQAGRENNLCRELSIEIRTALSEKYDGLLFDPPSSSDLHDYAEHFSRTLDGHLTILAINKKHPLASTINNDDIESCLIAHFNRKEINFQHSNCCIMTDTAAIATAVSKACGFISFSVTKRII